MHAREQIREAVMTQVTGLVTTGTNVSESRVYAHQVLPSLAVYTLEEQNLNFETLGAKQKRELTLMVEARAKPADGSAAVDDQLDTICEEVEKALADDVRLGNRLQYLELAKTTIELSGEQERPVGIARMEWRAVYHVLASDPGTILQT